MSDDSNFLFELIKNHYRNLDLINRFEENCDEVISDLVDSFVAALESEMSYGQTVNIERKRIDKSLSKYGFNYWKDVLKLELINNDKFEQYIGSKI